VSGDFEVPIVTSGDGGDVLICVNGMQQTMGMWGTMVRRMVGTGYRTVLFDFPHQGRSIGHGEGSLTLDEQVAVLDLVVGHVADAPIALLGGSWGALVSAAYAATHPQRVSKLVLGGFQTRSTAKLQDVARRGRLLVEQGRGPELATLFVSEFGAGIDASHRAAIEVQFRDLRPEQFRQMYDSARLLVEQSDFEAMVDLRRIAAHTLIVNGELDPLVDASQTAATAARFPSAVYRVEKGAGHFLHFERPSILETYVRFLTGGDIPRAPLPLPMPGGGWALGA
jgi:pimeloyl-ACP methyl ester carboxylesterase